MAPPRGRRNISEEEKQRKARMKALLEVSGTKTLADAQELLREMARELFDGLLEGEMDTHLKEPAPGNHRNGYSRKQVRSQHGEIELKIPRDRQAEFEPQIVPKYSKDIVGLDQKVLSMYARGQSVREISEQIEEIYGFGLSADAVSNLTDRILPVIEEWQNRPLSAAYSCLWLDGLVVKVRGDSGVVGPVCAHIVLGLTMEGHKEVLGMWFSETESARFWLTVLNDLKSRGVQDILIATVDGLTGFSQAIQHVYPQTVVQRCVVHQIRNACKFVSYKDLKPFCKDMKNIYTAPNRQAGKEQLEAFADKWEQQYAYAIRSWRQNWDELSTFFDFPVEIRKLIYTTNPIESLNRSLRRHTKTRASFPNQKAALKVLYLGMVQASKKWTQRVHGWSSILGQLEILFGERVSKFL